MSETKHTLSQLWNDGVMIKANGALIGQATSEEYARRIVACVNAFKGLSTDEIETIPVPLDQLARDYRAMRRQNDELLAALEEATDVVIGHYGAEGRLAKNCLAAIARVKGGAA